MPITNTEQKSMNDQPLSAADRMEAFREHMKIEESGLSAYLASLPFAPDPFQEEALERLALGNSVLVCAPTGAGKTVVGEGAAYLARKSGKRVFYTTPIKALSNQKLRDFRKTFGDGEVGLLTGDTAINPGAPIIVMTTEVLRNMIYAGQNLDDLGVVVMDEVHYLSDKLRGPVWEEVLIQLPTDVLVVALSATLSNAGEFGRWMESVRGSCDVVVSDKRPVPLYQEMMVGSRLFDLYTRPKAVAAGKAPRVLNPDLLDAVYHSQVRSEGGYRGRRGTRPQPVSRYRMIEKLLQKRLLPAIVFVFSRAGCEDAAAESATYGFPLTTFEERAQIAAEVDATLALIPVEDHAALDLHRWAHTLEEGVAAHHAGLLPQQKEAVERLFTAGLIKVVFATETLALGINMPARTVVIEAMEKWDGSEHVRLTPREYTQLTGRAGRRGIDVEGHAVVPSRGVVTPEEVAELSSGRSYPLHSAFVPNYNMAVNLLSRMSYDQAEEILESSFAQFQADASVVKDASKLRRTNRRLEEVQASLLCDRGDAAEYFELREDVSALQKKAAKAARASRHSQDMKMLSGLRVGDVVRYRRGRRARNAVVVQAPSPGFATPLARVVSEDAKAGSLGPREAEDGLEILGRMPVPERGARRPSDRAKLAAELRHGDFQKKRSRFKARDDKKVRDLLDQAALLEEKLRNHPVHQCPERESHASLGHQYARLIRERNAVATKINASSAKIVEEFQAVCQVLRRLGFLNGDKVTARGERLRRIYGERDLLVAQVIAEGSWAGLNAEELAAIVAGVVYEPRGDDTGSGDSTYLGSVALEEAWGETMAAYKRIHKVEVGANSEVTPEPSPTLVRPMFRWARGASLAKILEETELSGGDFVRWVRQVLDMLDQLRRLDDSDLARTANRARQKLLHGVVAWTEFG